MLKAIKSLFRGTVAQPGAMPTDPSDPSYVPTPKPKLQTVDALHPEVRRKLAQLPPGTAKVQRGVGIVYGADGRPKITADWLNGLSAPERQAVDANLLAHGWRIGPNNVVERV